MGITTKLRKRITCFRNNLSEHIPQMLVTLILIALTLAFLWNRMVITIGSGEMGVLYKRFFGGTVVDIFYGEGIQLIFPWDKMTVYNVRFQTSHQGVDALTKLGLMVHLDVAVRYRPDYQVLGVLHQAVGTDYYNAIVKPEVEAALRAVVGNYDAEEIYSNKNAAIQTFLNETLKQVSRRFVQIDSVMITKVTLPEEIQKAILNKVEQEQLALAYLFKIEREKQEAIRKKVEADGIKLYNDTINASLSENILRYEGINATKELSKSPNSKVIVIGAGKSGLPVLLDTGK
ncbi:prohibitin family protein [Candidatus Magnetomonas plexicatena]|uniref:prohibitin family protein n=1 Tax=Candidatus Magnetomonas plexicatena TaxID=2552947 RepID=UPI001C761302|nr:prohibitin family protein [Nitrospirales bacterium LBB_01]